MLMSSSTSTKNTYPCSFSSKRKLHSPKQHIAFRRRSPSSRLILSFAFCLVCHRSLAAATSSDVVSSAFHRRKRDTTVTTNRMPDEMAVKRAYRRNLLSGRSLMKYSGAIPTRFNSLAIISLDDDFVVIPDKHYYGKKAIPATNEISLRIARPGMNKLISLALRTRGGSDDSSVSPAAATTAGDEHNSGGLLSAVACVAKWVGESSERSWAILVFAIIIEILATTMLKIASDESSLPYTVAAMSMYNISLLSFAACLKKIDVSIAYAIWSALGTALVSIAGFMMFGEEINTVKVVSLVLIMIGVVGLNLSH